MLGVLILYTSSRSYSLKSSLNDISFEKVFHGSFKEGREDVNDDARQQPMKTWKQMKKMILDNRRMSTRIRKVDDDVGIWPNNFYGCFKHETCGSEDCSKICKILSKNKIAWTSHGHQEMLTSFNDYSDLLKKGHNW